MQPTQKKLLASLEAALNATNVIQVEDRTFGVDHYAGTLDCLLHVATPAGSVPIAIETKKRAYPRDARDAQWHLETFRKDNPEITQLIPMVVAEHISEGAKADLRHHGIAYFDASGTLYLRYQNLYIDIQRHRSTPLLRREDLKLFTEAREQVVHALLHARHDFLSGLELAELAKTSTYTVSTVLNELSRLEWIATEGSGRTMRRRLSRPKDLLDAWAEAWKSRRQIQTRWYFYTAKPSDVFEKIANKLATESTDGCVLTGAGVGNLISPHLTGTDMTDIIIGPGDAAKYADVLSLKRAEKGANVTLTERTGASFLFTREHSTGATLASPFIVYLDLLDGRGRNKELAAELREKHLEL